MAARKSICCPIDFYAVSVFGLEEAAEQARRSGGALTLLHVREALPPPSAGRDAGLTGGTGAGCGRA
jgi:hypothetical protein